MLSLLIASACTWLVVLWKTGTLGWLSFLAFLVMHLAGLVFVFLRAVKRGSEGVPAFDRKAFLLESTEVVRLDVDSSTGTTPALVVEWDEKEAAEVRLSCRGEEWTEDAQAIVRSCSLVGGKDAIAVEVSRSLLFKSQYVATVGGKDITVACRFPRLETVSNMRDFGGYTTKDGHTVAWRKLYRSAQWSDLSKEEYARLTDELGIRAAIDLRNEKEKSMGKTLPAVVEACQGDRDAIKCLAVGVEGKLTLRDLYDIFTRILFNRAELAPALGQYYIDMVKSGAKEWATFVETFADEANLPIAFFCKSGKDRTGIGASMILSLLGVDEDTVVREYSLTNLGFDQAYEQFKKANVLRSLGVPDEDLRCVLVVDPEWLRSLYRFINETYGSLEDYLIKEGGMKEDTVARLRSNLLV